MYSSVYCPYCTHHLCHMLCTVNVNTFSKKWQCAVLIRLIQVEFLTEYCFHQIRQSMYGQRNARQCMLFLFMFVNSPEFQKYDYEPLGCAHCLLWDKEGLTRISSITFAYCYHCAASCVWLVRVRPGKRGYLGAARASSNQRGCQGIHQNEGAYHHLMETCLNINK